MNLQKGEEKHYLAQHPLLQQIPELEDDIIVPGKFYFLKYHHQIHLLI